MLALCWYAVWVIAAIYVGLDNLTQLPLIHRRAEYGMILASGNFFLFLAGFAVVIGRVSSETPLNGFDE